MTTCTIDGLAFTVQVAKFTKHDVEKRFLEEAEMETHHNLSNKGVVRRKDKADDKLPPVKTDSLDLQVPRRTFVKTKRQIQGRTVRRRFRMNRIFSVTEIVILKNEVDAIGDAVIATPESLPVHKREHPVSGLEALVIVKERYQTAVVHSS